MCFPCLVHALNCNHLSVFSKVKNVWFLWPGIALLFIDHRFVQKVQISVSLCSLKPREADWDQTGMTEVDWCLTGDTKRTWSLPRTRISCFHLRVFVSLFIRLLKRFDWACWKGEARHKDGPMTFIGLGGGMLSSVYYQHHSHWTKHFLQDYSHWQNWRHLNSSI